MKNINFGPAIAALRHVGTYAAGIVTGLVLFGMSHDDAVKLTDAIVQLSKSAGDVLAALGVIIPVVTGYFAAKSATSSSQVKNIKTMSVENANAAVAALPNEAKNAIQLATITNEEKIAAVAAIPDVAAVLVKPTATNGTATIAADPAQPKVKTAIT